MIAIISYYNPFQNLDGFCVHLYYMYIVFPVAVPVLFYVDVMIMLPCM